MRGQPSAAREEEAMSDFVLLYEGGSMPESEEAQKQVMAAWEAWFTSIGGTLKHPGNPFTPASKTISSDGAVSDGAEVLYKTTDYWSREHERCIAWNDPTLAIEWPLKGSPLLSARDGQGSALQAAEVFG